MVKIAKVGFYGGKTRDLQKRIAYERVAHSFKVANVYMYLGSRANVDPQISDIQVTTFMEVPDRAYAKDPVPINIGFEKAREQVVDYSQFGVIDPMGYDQLVRVHVNSFDDMGRKIVEGDVIEIDFFEQGGKKAFWEVTDVDHSQEFEEFYVTVKLKILEDSRSTREISHNNSIGQTLEDIVDDHNEHAEDQVPHNGLDDSKIDNGENNPETSEEYDGRNDPSKSFLDDFDGDLI